MNTSKRTLSTLAAWWSRRPAREQGLLTAAALLVAGALLWSLALAPAWRTVKAYPVQRAALDTQLTSMWALEARARALQSRPALTAQAMRAGLQAAVAGLGPKASLQVLNQQATVTLQGLDAGTLAGWLALVRTETRLLPSQAQWKRTGNTWSGTVQFTLPVE